jgi:hypothetical protein
MTGLPADFHAADMLADDHSVIDDTHATSDGQDGNHTPTEVAATNHQGTDGHDGTVVARSEQGLTGQGDGHETGVQPEVAVAGEQGEHDAAVMVAAGEPAVDPNAGPETGHGSGPEAGKDAGTEPHADDTDAGQQTEGDGAEPVLVADAGGEGEAAEATATAEVVDHSDLRQLAEGDHALNFEHVDQIAGQAGSQESDGTGSDHSSTELALNDHDVLDLSGSGDINLGQFATSDDQTVEAAPVVPGDTASSIAVAVEPVSAEVTEPVYDMPSYGSQSPWIDDTDRVVA